MIDPDIHVMARAQSSTRHREAGQPARSIADYGSTPELIMNTRLSLIHAPLVLLPVFALSTGCKDEDDGDDFGYTVGVDDIGSESEDESESESESGESESTTETDTTTEESTETDTTTEESTETDTTTEESTETTDGSTFCDPGETVCQDNDVATCLMDGSEYGAPVPCGESQDCMDGACVELCVIAELAPSSVGCSFFAHKMDNFTDADNPQPEPNDSFVIGNVSQETSATVQLYFMPNGTNIEQAQGAPIVVPPAGTQTFNLTNLPIESVSQLRKGGTYRVQSNIPVVAYLHSPLQAVATNDASMLLPEHALRQNHVVASYYPWLANYYPSYFNVIATENNTLVSWTPPVQTNAGVGVPLVLANTTGQVIMNRGDTLQVVANNHIDVSGTYVSGNKPIVVFGGNEAVNVPAGVKYADHIEEQMLPLDYWGTEYVGPRAPPRGTEKYHWRIYGGEDGVTVSVSPAQAGFPINLDRGEWFYFNTTQSVIFTGDGPFMPVQYLEGKSEVGGATTGDPSMYQMVPSEQFLDRYAFATGIGYTVNYVQIIRELGGPAVYVDGSPVGAYTTIGNYQVADYQVSQGTHFATSAEPFGIIQLGYTNATSYAYPGGMKLSEINPQ
jgi:hypothetical protein